MEHLQEQPAALRACTDSYGGTAILESIYHQEGSMRILMLAQFYPPTIGGEERHVADLSAELAARGHRVSVATLWNKGFARFEIERGVRIHRMRGTLQRMEAIFSYKDRQFAPPFTDPEALWALRRIISEERPDIIHA